MLSTDWHDILDKIKKCFEELSGASKFVIVLTILLFMSNVIINVWSSRTYQDVEQAIDGVINNNTKELFMDFWLWEIIEKIKEYVKYLFFFLISFIAYYISLYVGKLLGFFKSIAEFFSDINEDPFFVKVLVIYDVVGIFFDIYTIYSLVII